MIKYGIVGAGWRSEFYLRIAALMPDTFKVSGIYIRNKQKQAEFSKKYNVPIFDTLEKLLETDYDFIVSCVNKAGICDTVRGLADKNIPLLTETPIGTSNKEIDDFLCEIKPDWRVQVAEQFHFMPRNAAIKSVIDSGILGEITQVQLSCCHDYHAASLIRFFLNTGDEMPKGFSFTQSDTVNRYNSRRGLLSEPETVTAEEKFVVLRFKEKTAIYDFNYEQYFSDIRRSRILIRGTNGEILNNECTYLKNGFPHSFRLRRNSYGANESLDGFTLVNITAEGKVVYENPFKGARLSDEEIAIATCLLNMKKYLETGIPFYSLKEAALDSKIFLSV
ncbi:MAG: Gfo/Idh/MocA family oxidoreductase [Acutalibacteraceae bacterium]|nr:Gfo/Idh/MocA family oxidoreductase [Acutalibacteraceae bacterium]